MKYNQNTVNPTKGKINDQPEIIVLWGMKNRCYYPKHPGYAEYGGRGIKVCERWRKRGGLWNFIDDMGRRPSKAHSIDRIDVNGDYTPNNCRWATAKEQADNRRIRADNISGLAGVSYDNTHKRWLVRVTMGNGKRKCLGYYKDVQSAVKAKQSYGLL